MPLLDEGVAASVLDVLDKDIVELRAVSDLALNSAQDFFRLALDVRVDAMSLRHIQLPPEGYSLQMGVYFEGTGSHWLHFALVAATLYIC